MIFVNTQNSIVRYNLAKFYLLFLSLKKSMSLNFPYKCLKLLYFTILCHKNLFLLFLTINNLNCPYLETLKQLNQIIFDIQDIWVRKILVKIPTNILGLFLIPML